MNRDIILIVRKDGHKEECAWKCSSVNEASCMSNWLRDNHIECRQISNTEWEALPERGA